MKVYNYPQMRPKKTSVKPFKGGGKAVDAETKLKSLEEALLNRRTDPSLDFPPTVASADEKPSSESTTDDSEDACEVEPSGESLSVPESPDNDLDREDPTETPAAEDISTKRDFSAPSEFEITPSYSSEVQHDQHAVLPPINGSTAPQASEPNPSGLPANIGATTGELEETDLATATEDPKNSIMDCVETGSEVSPNVAILTNKNGNDPTKSDAFQLGSSSAPLVSDGISKPEGKAGPSDSPTAKAPIAEPPGDVLPLPTTKYPAVTLLLRAEEQTKDSGQADIVAFDSTDSALLLPNEQDSAESADHDVKESDKGLDANATSVGHIIASTAADVTTNATTPQVSAPAAGSATVIAHDVVAARQIIYVAADAENQNPKVEDKPSDGAPTADEPKKKKLRPEPVVIILPLLADRPARLAELKSKLEALLASMTAQHHAVFAPGSKKDSALRAVRNRLFPTPYDFGLAARASDFFKQVDPKFGKLMVRVGTCLELLHTVAPQQEKKFAAVFAALVLEYPWGPPPCLRSKLTRFKWVDAETVEQAT